jgi:hypothetical protein
MSGIYAFCRSSIHFVVLVFSFICITLSCCEWCLVPSMGGYAYLPFVDFCLMDFSEVITCLMIALKVTNIIVVVGNISSYSSLPSPLCLKVFLNHSIPVFNPTALALGGKAI